MERVSFKRRKAPASARGLTGCAGLRKCLGVTLTVHAKRIKWIAQQMQKLWPRLHEMQVQYKYRCKLQRSGPTDRAPAAAAHGPSQQAAKMLLVSGCHNNANEVDDGGDGNRIDTFLVASFLNNRHVDDDHEMPDQAADQSRILGCPAARDAVAPGPGPSWQPACATRSEVRALRLPGCSAQPPCFLFTHGDVQTCH
jgi:hypothetical protein